MVYALGGVSGAHFNPAVTTALTLAGKSPVGDIGNLRLRGPRTPWTVRKDGR